MNISAKDMNPYKKLACAVIVGAIQQAQEKVNKKNMADVRAAQRFVSVKDNEMFDFWADVIGFDPGRLRKGIRANIGDGIRVQKRSGYRKKETNPRNKLSQDEKAAFLSDMSAGVPVAALGKRYKIKNSSCYYYAKLHKINLKTASGVYKP